MIVANQGLPRLSSIVPIPTIPSTAMQLRRDIRGLSSKILVTLAFGMVNTAKQQDLGGLIEFHHDTEVDVLSARQLARWSCSRAQGGDATRSVRLNGPWLELS